jgi:hypothetical protein
MFKFSANEILLRKFNGMNIKLILYTAGNIMKKVNFVCVDGQKCLVLETGLKCPTILA